MTTRGHSVSVHVALDACAGLLTTSTAAKGKYIQQEGLRGWAMWEASSDYDNQLVGAIRNASMTGCSFHSLMVDN